MVQEMDGRVCLVTGANAGIGYETALGLAHQGATMVLVARDRAKGEEAKRRIEQTTGNPSIDLLIADLAVMDSVRGLAQAFTERHDRLHVLVNNAGLVLSKREVTADGFERTFATNHLSMFLLTRLLLDTLRASAPARIVNVASEAHRSGRLDLDDLQSERSYSTFRVYGTTKLQNILFTTELARRLEGSGVTANALHPGLVRSNFGRNNRGPMRLVMPVLQRFAITPEQGAQTSLYLATSPDVEGVSGRYFDKSAPREPAPAAQDADAARRLWEVSERLVGLPVS